MTARMTVYRALCALGFAMASWSSAARAQPDAGDGFMFHAPRGGLSLRIGYARPSADSKVFDFVSKQLTVGKGDFAGGSIAADVEIPVATRAAVLVGAAISARAAQSEYRNFVDNNDLPIEQRTEFRRVPLSLGVKYYLAPPGRALSRLAWVPATVAPYVAAGGGWTYYSFRQSGDFVDFKTLDVFTSTMQSYGWSSAMYAATGVHYGLSAHADLVTEARYDRSRAPMSNDFQGFDRISLSGLSLTAGVHFRF